MTSPGIWKGDFKLTLGPYAHCENCNFVAELTEVALYRYFDGEVTVCDTCHGRFDWFKALTHSAGFTWATFTAVRALVTHFEVSLVPGETKEIDFAKEMKGLDGRILMVHYEARPGQEDAVSPVELHGAIPVRRNQPKVSLYGRGGSGKTDINISFVWTPRSKDDASWESIVDAFEALNAGDYTDALLPANVAFEVRLGRLLNDLFRAKTSIGKERVGRFLSDGATYGHQVEVLLPFVCSVLALPLMPEPVTVGLKHLRKHRNSLAHTGEPDTPVDKAEAVRLAVSAVLGCVYVDFLRKRLGLA